MLLFGTPRRACHAHTLSLQRHPQSKCGLPPSGPWGWATGEHCSCLRAAAEPTGKEGEVVQGGVCLAS